VKARVATKAAGGEETSQRDWFLKDSTWKDVTWTFAPTNVLEEDYPVRMRWDFELPSGRRFTDPHHAALLESARQLVFLIRRRALLSELPQRATTVAGYFMCLRKLLRWMDEEAFRRFADLDSAALVRFQCDIVQRKNRTGAPVSPSTVQGFINLLVYLYRFRDELGDALSVDPCPGQTAGELAGVHRSHTHRGPHTPDAIAVPLIQGAIEFLTSSAFGILHARELYASAIAAAQRRGRSEVACNCTAVRALRNVTIVTPRGLQTDLSARDLSELLDMLYAACFVVISYLVGPRVSEIMHLKADCVRSRAMRDSNVASEVVVMVGTIFKQEAHYHGRPHEWVVPPAATHAISVLEALSAPHRSQTGRRDLWLRVYGDWRSRGATEWRHSSRGPFHIPTSTCFVYLLNRFAVWIGLPDHDGKPWHLTTHQGRRTFARFAALRDRSALFALAQHFGHRDYATTERGYVGNDYALDREIHTEILEQSVSAWEHMLSVPTLGGRAGSEILAKRPQFRGIRMKADLKAYARMLVEAGLILGICDYGYCVYREEYSACRGNATGPNPVNREPSTCTRCKNFAVSVQHRPYWLEQLRRCELLLSEPALPTQTLKIVRERLEEARATIRSIDSTAKEERHGRKIPR
jgi:integrase